MSNSAHHVQVYFGKSSNKGLFLFLQLPLLFYHTITESTLRLVTSAVKPLQSIPIVCGEIPGSPANCQALLETSPRIQYGARSTRSIKTIGAVSRYSWQQSRKFSAVDTHDVFLSSFAGARGHSFSRLFGNSANIPGPIQFRQKSIHLDNIEPTVQPYIVHINLLAKVIAKNGCANEISNPRHVGVSSTATVRLGQVGSCE